jgi:titin
MKTLKYLFTAKFFPCIILALLTALSDWSALPATFTVTNAADTGLGTLRQAILDANAVPGLDTIRFLIATGAQTINLTSPLPLMTGPVLIDGTTQPGFMGSPLIELNGAGAGFNANGLWLSGGSSALVGLIINRFANSGILVQSNGHNVIQGNFIGTDRTGTAAAPNGFGIMLQRAHTNQIGGTTVGARNLISANQSDGIWIGNSSNNVVEGNFIGTDRTGGSALGNGGNGLLVQGIANTIGGDDAGAGNVMSANGLFGVDATANFNVIQGNFIGTDVGGTIALPNGLCGIRLNNAAQTTIGGTAIGNRNIISGNGVHGIEIAGTGARDNVVQGNFLGTDVSGTRSLGNNVAGVALNFAGGNLIGGADEGAGNLISANSASGIWMFSGVASFNTVQGNLIGTDVSGRAPLGNREHGILLSDAPNNQIGGAEPGARNVISGNSNDGIRLTGGGATANTVEGNFIGTDLTGTNALANGTSGLGIMDAPMNTIGGPDISSRNVISGNAENGILIQGAAALGNVVQGNFIGTDVAGRAKVGNHGSGVFVLAASNNNIGGTDSGSGNLISGNDAGISISSEGSTHASGNVIQGNRIGTDISGTQSLGNEADGVSITGDNTTIGGGEIGAKNLISGNTTFAIALYGTNNVVQGNLIGTDISGTKALPNVTSPITIWFGFGPPTVLNHAVLVTDSGHLIGGSSPLERNVISGNLGNGIALVSRARDCVVSGNFIGVDISGNSSLPNSGAGVLLSGAAQNNFIGGFSPGEGNRIAFNRSDGILVRELGTSSNSFLANSIFSNGGLGINLQPTGETNNAVTLNDATDSDTGPNNLQNYPIITNVTYASSSASIQGILRSAPNRDYDIDFYLNTATDPSGFGEGQTYLGRASLETDGSGVGTFEFTVSGSYSNQFITATATDSLSGDTSEFSEGAGGLVIRSIRRMGNDILISFTTSAAKNYRLEYTTSLSPPISWQIVNGAGVVPGTGAVVTVSDSAIANQPGLFYRVRQL